MTQSGRSKVQRIKASRRGNADRCSRIPRGRVGVARQRHAGDGKSENATIPGASGSESNDSTPVGGAGYNARGETAPPARDSRIGNKGTILIAHRDCSLGGVTLARAA